MKNRTIKKLIISLGFISSIIFTSCMGSDDEKIKKENIERETLYKKLIGGNYKLRKFNIKTTKTTETKGSFFLLVGNYSSTTIENEKIRFYFKNYNNEYQFMEKNINEVNIKIDNKILEPYIKFYYNIVYFNHISESDYNYICTNNINKVVIYCKDSDFIPEININDLK